MNEPNPPENLRRCVLVVDDDDDIREMLQQILVMEGFEALGAREGGDALRQLRANPRTALVLLDLTMPGMSGREFLSRRRAEDAISNVPVVIVSATEEYEITPGDGVLASLRKPVDFETLFAYCRGAG